jgi:exodeoxyribonuclease III
LDRLRSDLIVLQECTPPATIDNQCVWFKGSAAKNVGVVASGDWRLKVGPDWSLSQDSAYPVKVSGPAEFNLLGVWAQGPNYVPALLHALDRHQEFLRSGPSIVIGDFNSHPLVKQSRTANHATLNERLKREFGLVSAFDVFSERSGGLEEPPTYYHQWHEDQPFHLDYCYFPQAWISRLKSLEIGSYQEWATRSDHRPVTVEFTD